MLSTGRDTTLVPGTPPTPPRLFLAGVTADRGLLQGGWWPRSWEPVAELPGLVLALCAWHGPIHEIHLNRDTWQRRYGRLAVAAGAVLLGWPPHLGPALLTAVGDHDYHINLLVVPPTAAIAAARHAMTLATDPHNTLLAPQILAAAAGKAVDLTGRISQT